MRRVGLPGGRVIGVGSCLGVGWGRGGFRWGPFCWSDKYLIQSLLIEQEMTETIQDYFRRFDTSVTESVYSHFSLADYERNKAVNEFLDYDRESLFRKNGQFCGIRNIDNSCYLSVTLQVLFNIQGLRDKVFRVSGEGQTKFIRELQKLFAMMWKGSLIYVDPTNLFQVLKGLHPALFVAGNQNDFHEVFTVVLDELEKGFSSEEDKRFLRKLFYGKTRIEIVDSEKNGINVAANDPGNSFNLINLSSESHSFDTALKNFKRESINGYVNEKGDVINAEREIHFVETPGILSFFINRVSYKDKKLEKDCSEFGFEDKIFFNKANVSKIGHNSDAELDRQSKVLREWIQSIIKSKTILQETHLYFEGNEFSDVHVPSIENPLGEPSKEKIKEYLKAEIQQIDKKVGEAEKEIEEIEKKRQKMAEDNYSELYHLWAVMIHAGKTAESGHYKMCIRMQGEKGGWVEFNDRRAEDISYEKVEEYKKKGQICCIFYRRSSLTCFSENSPIPSSLKKLVKDEQMQIYKKIDNARLLQALYQQFESVNMIWDFENLVLRQQEKISTYFFKPLMHLILQQAPTQTCKAFLLYEMISSPKFIPNLKDKFLDPCRQIKIPRLEFPIPPQYFDLSESLREFCRLELVSPIESYELISFYMDITISDKILATMFDRIREVILMKGIFYESLFVEYGLLSSYEEIRKSNDRIINALRSDDPCVLVNVPIRSAIEEQYLKGVKNPECGAKGVLKKPDAAVMVRLLDDMPVLFSKRFGFWIKLREKVVEIDESLLKEYRSMWREYIVEVK